MVEVILKRLLVFPFTDIFSFHWYPFLTFLFQEFEVKFLQYILAGNIGQYLLYIYLTENDMYIEYV